MAEFQETYLTIISDFCASNEIIAKWAQYGQKQIEGIKYVVLLETVFMS